MVKLLLAAQEPDKAALSTVGFFSVFSSDHKTKGYSRCDTKDAALRMKRGQTPRGLSVLPLGSFPDPCKPQPDVLRRRASEGGNVLINKLI